ncbi:DUF1876 domain-containing protein [Nocardioides limicola]|uniref:DUF1876 domain-containing protein n=1 Tax=Nocardioides limicola TaxID=2803368 RepID=UPI00193C7E6B|nr:DUF1876 domain-containing protein [Nocardioides sp. DJM-14]
MTTKTWTVNLVLDEQGDDTYADAVLDVGKGEEKWLKGRGFSRKHPRDEAAPRIGDELAAARALSDLAHQLLGVAAEDIERKTHTPPRSLSL